jgi:dihydropteroate synthase
VYALQETGAVEMAANLGVPVCLMHMQGIPESMQESPAYHDVVAEVTGFLMGRAQACIAAGIPRQQIVLDPGFGFGKTVEHNLQLLHHLDQLVSSGFPVLVGLSRKSLIGKVLDLPVDKRLYPSVALAVLAVWKGAAIVRCHDVRETSEAIRMCQAVMNA